MNDKDSNGKPLLIGKGDGNVDEANLGLLSNVGNDDNDGIGNDGDEGRELKPAKNSKKKFRKEKNVKKGKKNNDPSSRCSFIPVSYMLASSHSKTDSTITLPFELTSIRFFSSNLFLES